MCDQNHYVEHNWQRFGPLYREEAKRLAQELAEALKRLEDNKNDTGGQHD